MDGRQEVKQRMEITSMQEFTKQKNLITSQARIY